MANNKEKEILLKLDHVKQYFPVKNESLFSTKKRSVKAVDNVSINIYEGETFGLVGESGCGKSTLGRSLLQLYDQTDGRTMYYGVDRDEIAPKYVLDTLTNLVDNRKELDKLREEEEKVKKQYDSLAEGESKENALDKYNLCHKEARDKFIDIVQLIGGFYVLDDLQPISDILTKEYKESIDVRKLKDEINQDNNKLAAKNFRLRDKGNSEAEIKSKTQADVDKIREKQKQLASEEKDLEEVRNEIYSLIDKYKSHPEWDKYEAYREKGIDLAKLDHEEMRRLRKDLQLIFQDPYSSLNPRMTVGQIISEGLLAHNMFDANDPKLQDYVVDIMEKCGLASYFLHRYPHQFSGGQRQRIGIARSVALNPKFIVCDEAVSALDVSIQSQIINLLLDLKEEHNLTYMFISHDLSVIKYISDRVGVMYLGNIVELSPTEELYERPMHPYTEALLSAIPTTDIESNREPVLLEGDIPSNIEPPKGCKFHTRCRYATEICSEVVPELEEVTPGHFVACHHKLNQDD